MLPHWRYLLDNLFGTVRAVSCLGATHIPERRDEAGRQYPATAADAAYACFELDGGIIAQVNSSFCTRVRRDDLLTFRVDGTNGSAVAGLRRCFVQRGDRTPRTVWNPDVDEPHDYLTDWEEVPDDGPYENAFKCEWEAFIRHLFTDAPFKWDLLEGAKGVQLAELAMQSCAERRWVDVPELEPESADRPGPQNVAA